MPKTYGDVFDAKIRKFRTNNMTLKEIAWNLNASPAFVRARIQLLHAKGWLTDDQAFTRRGKGGTRSGQKFLAGKAGGAIHDWLTKDEARRLKAEVEDGGYGGYNELLSELFKDWVAEKDLKAP